MSESTPTPTPTPTPNPDLAKLTHNQVMSMQIASAFMAVGFLRELIDAGALVGRSDQATELLNRYDIYSSEIKSRRVSPDAYATI